jgi:hypothetical protein
MRAETLAFCEEVMWKQQRPLGDLLHAKFTYATPSLAKFYGLPVHHGDGLARYDLADVPERGGVLTQGSVLTVGGDEASTVTRGLFLLNDILRGTVNNPPPGLDTRPVPARPGLSKRDVAQQRIDNTAEPPNGTARAGGPSIDQVIRRAQYPDGFPAGIVPTLLAGTFFRRNDRLSRYVQSFNDDGTPAAAMQERPRDLFDRVFGAYGLDETAPDALRQRLQRSVLDSVMEQYRYFTGANSPLGAASKARVTDHLDRIREFEQRAYAMEMRDPEAPPLPPRSNLIHGGEADPGGEGIDITLSELVEGWRLMADLYATAIQTDRVRIGSLTFLAAGERIRLKGDYEYEGRKIFHFDDAAQHKASGSAGCSHEWWHKFDEKKANDALRAHAHMKMRELAYFLKRLDSPDTREANGKTILENSLITISTESGDGRHNDSKRELSGVFHAITGANGRFKTGRILEVNAEGLDLYNSMLGAMGASRRLGPTDREMKRVEAIHA